MQTQPLILCVDDNKTIISFLVNYLSRNGYQILTAFDGEEGLAKMKEFHPDLTLLDLNMPKMTGFDVAYVAHNDPELINIPIVILSALSQAHNKERHELRNVYDYLTKPVNPAKLLSVIDTTLKKSKRLHA